MIDLNARRQARASKEPMPFNEAAEAVLALPQTAPEPVVTPDNAQELIGPNLGEMSDAEVAEWTGRIGEELEHVTQMLSALYQSGKNEIERRIRERQKTNPAARAIPHPTFEIEMVDEFAPYRSDVEKLARAATMLSEDEAAKLVKHVKERVEVIPAHTVAGNVASIKALANKYAGTEVGELLASAITRDKTGEKLLFKRRPVPTKKAVRA